MFAALWPKFESALLLQVLYAGFRHTDDSHRPGTSDLQPIPSTVVVSGHAAAGLIQQDPSIVWKELAGNLESSIGIFASPTNEKAIEGQQTVNYSTALCVDVETVPTTR